MTLLTPSYKVFVQTSVPTAHNLAYICKKKNTFGTDKNARQGKKALRVLKVHHTVVSYDEGLLGTTPTSFGAFNASSKSRIQIFSSRSSSLRVPIAATVLLQFLVGVLGLLNRQLLFSTALMIGFLVSIILSSWKWKRVSFLDPKMPLLLRS